jgi:hypothetical protein
VGALALLEGGLAADLDGELGRAEDEIVEDGVRGDPEVGLAIAGQGRRVDPTLLERHPRRRQERQDRDRDDDDRCGDAGGDGGDPLGDGARRDGLSSHRRMVDRADRIVASALPATRNC